MKYQAVKYNSREEAMAAFIKMRDRKREWLKKHLASVNFDEINIVKYGTPKSTVVGMQGGILFDDEERNRTEWNGTAYNVDNILNVLKAL